MSVFNNILRSNNLPSTTQYNSHTLVGLWGTTGADKVSPFEKCLGYASYQITIRSSYGFTLEIEFSDAQSSDASNINKEFRAVIPAGQYRHFSIPINGDQVRFRCRKTNPGDANPTTTDALNIQAVASLSSHYILT